MKIKENFDLDMLLDYKFEKINKEEELENENYTIANFDYLLQIGPGRRGQYYYLLVKSESRIVYIYSSDSDGSGTACPMCNELIELITQGIIVI